MKKLGLLFIILGLLAAVGWWFELQLPTLSWFFGISEAFGYTCSGLAILLGGWCIRKKHKPLTPMTQRRIARFKGISRGYISLLILSGLLGIAALDQLVVGKRALIVKHDGDWYFPALMQRSYKGSVFGREGEDAVVETNYRDLQRVYRETESENWLLLPLIPYDPTHDSITSITRPLDEVDGIVIDTRSGKPYSGLASTLYDVHDPTSVHVRYKFRRGLRQGEAKGRSAERIPVYTAVYEAGKLLKQTYDGEGPVEDFLNQEVSSLREIDHKPCYPALTEKHYLGTDSKGNDIAAYLFGGLQVNFKAAILYIPCVYLIGITVGLLMGYFGGWFDIIAQRLIEIFSNIPFLFVIIILSGMIEDQFRGLGLILVILVLFGWMGMTYLMRTAALREKARDYVAAARVMGSSTSRILFRHILPNTVAIIVTLVPFSVSGVIMSLLSLDYLGYGLPTSYPTWGRLLSNGLDNLSSPWIVSSAFFMLVLLLVLVTFIGEAVREAFDPKKFTTYR